MSYSDQQNLSVDPEFVDRLWAATATEAQAKPADDPPARYVLANPYKGADLFMPYVATAPGFGDLYAAGGQEAITDGDILSAVQAAWPRVQVPS